MCTSLKLHVRVCVLFPQRRDVSGSDSDEGGGSSKPETEYEQPEHYRPQNNPGPTFQSISSRRWRSLEWSRKWHYFKR